MSQLPSAKRKTFLECITLVFRDQQHLMLKVFQSFGKHLVLSPKADIKLQPGKQTRTFLEHSEFQHSVLHIDIVLINRQAKQ
jgi:hypothetical protein